MRVMEIGTQYYVILIKISHPECGISYAWRGFA